MSLCLRERARIVHAIASIAEQMRLLKAFLVFESREIAHERLAIPRRRRLEDRNDQPSAKRAIGKKASVRRAGGLAVRRPSICALVAATDRAPARHRAAAVERLNSVGDRGATIQAMATRGRDS